MIRGEVASDLSPRVSIETGNDEGDFEWLDVVVDTGFDGELSLPREAIQRLDLPYERLASVSLADEQRIRANACFAVVSWHGGLREVVVLEIAGEPLIGMSLLQGSRLKVDARRGGEVLIEEVP
jgi:clan AA aspartic protease